MQARELTRAERDKLLKDCNGCQAEGCACFHPPRHAEGKHTPCCERAKRTKS